MSEISNERLAEMKATWDGVSEEVHAVIVELEQRRAGKTTAALKSSGGIDTFTQVDKEKCAKAAELLGSAFTWANSAEGGQFWSQVHSRLTELSMWKKKAA